MKSSGRNDSLFLKRHLLKILVRRNIYTTLQNQLGGRERTRERVTLKMKATILPRLSLQEQKPNRKPRPDKECIGGVEILRVKWVETTTRQRETRRRDRDRHKGSAGIRARSAFERGG
jgi:hypothetical protein